MSQNSKIWSRRTNKNGSWACTHRFEDGTETYHYVNNDGSVYMKHRDGSTTYSPEEGSYLPRKERDPESNIPAPTVEEIAAEAKVVKEEHREYLVSRINYSKGARTTPRRRHFNRARLFPMLWHLLGHPTCRKGFELTIDAMFRRGNDCNQLRVLPGGTCIAPQRNSPLFPAPST
ncbi:hypothetical protein BJ322DRAFT_1016020 [Thelephora terrestris]|uniref:Uncharacterized protein n=1 Tax=Thelephora terrestris TaxID=56493 RepID=A0A9P6HP69_9AGAM|nr:hypothetical protein BJ322DRAFT_1016020 [Thelephora terrestris]